MTLEQTLNQRIADFAVLYFKLHHFHWFVEGKGFYSLHTLFEALYDEATALLDQYAERLLAIGGTPASTMQAYLSLTTLSEATTESDATAIAHVLIADYSTIVSALKTGIPVAEGENDPSTADLFIATIAGLEKHLWMLKQFVK